MNSRIPGLIGVVTLSGLLLGGCTAMAIQDREAKRLVAQYQNIVKAEAYLDKEQTLYLCVDLRKQKGVGSERVMVKITRRNFRIASYPTLLFMGGGKHLLDAKKYSKGCEIPADATFVKINLINIDSEVKKYSDLHSYLMRLPLGSGGFSVNLLNSEKLKVAGSSCKNSVKKKRCRYNAVYAWPRLVIKVKSKNRLSTVSIVAGHSNKKRGYKFGATVKAALIDTVTFPLQVLFQTGWGLSGGGR